MSSFAKQNEIPKKQEITKKVDPLPKEPVKKFSVIFVYSSKNDCRIWRNRRRRDAIWRRKTNWKKESTKENPMFTSSEDFLAS